jgi:hypothetical protein
MPCIFLYLLFLIAMQIVIIIPILSMRTLRLREARW